MQAARRGCCHLLHPLKQEVFWAAQIAATVQVFVGDRVVMISLFARKLTQAARCGCCHVLHPLKQEVFWDTQIAATVQVFGRQSRHDQSFGKEADASCEARLLPSVAPFEAGSVSGCTDCGNRAGAEKAASSCSAFPQQIAATVQVFGRQSRHDQPFGKEANASCEAAICCTL